MFSILREFENSFLSSKNSISKFFALRSRDTAGKWPDFVDDLEIMKFIRAQKCIRAKGPEWSHYSAYKGRDFRSYSNLRHDESLLLTISRLGSRMNLKPSTLVGHSLWAGQDEGQLSVSPDWPDVDVPPLMV